MGNQALARPAERSAVERGDGLRLFPRTADRIGGE